MDIRDFARDKHRSVDDAPFGGGAGMVMKPDVVDAAIRATRAPGDRLIYLSPRGRVFDQALARDLAAASGVTLLCGRYEGVDQRALDAVGAEEVSLGDFVLSGGEPAAVAVIDAVVRLLPGVMGNLASAGEESFGDYAGSLLLEYPPLHPPRRPGPIRTGLERMVPEVLVSGDHAKVAGWRRAEARGDHPGAPPGPLAEIPRRHVRSRRCRPPPGRRAVGTWGRKKAPPARQKTGATQSTANEPR